MYFTQYHGRDGRGAARPLTDRHKRPSHVIARKVIPGVSLAGKLVAMRVETGCQLTQRAIWLGHRNRMDSCEMVIFPTQRRAANEGGKWMSI